MSLAGTGELDDLENGGGGGNGVSDSKHHQHLQYSLNRGRKRSRPPKLAESSAQTAETEEFPRLTCTERKVRPSASFDYYSRVKKSLQEIPAEVLTRCEI